MVRAIIFVSAVFAMAAFVSAAPHHHSESLAETNIGHIGLADTNLQKVGNNAVDASNTHIHDLVQDIAVLSDDNSTEGEDHHDDEGSDC